MESIQQSLIIGLHAVVVTVFWNHHYIFGPCLLFFDTIHRNFGKRIGSKGWASRTGVRSRIGTGMGWARPSGRARTAVSTVLWTASAMSWLLAGSRLRLATNSQLRTGTDQGNLTVLGTVCMQGTCKFRTKIFYQSVCRFFDV